tara:strand:- start:36 stop:341 length:306 start_codon:yes stop_codon:yes gene_type:complete
MRNEQEYRGQTVSMNTTWADMMVSSGQTSDGRVCVVYDIAGCIVELTKGVDSQWYWFCEDLATFDSSWGDLSRMIDDDHGPFMYAEDALLDAEVAVGMVTA